MSAKGSRAVFGKVPFLLGRYPDRPAPAHIVNGFLTSSLGAGESASRIRVLLKGDPTQPLPSPPFNQGVVEGAAAEQMRRALRVITDPDRRSWEKVGSLFPLHGQFVGSDPSDDGFGRALWNIVQPHADGLSDSLHGLLNPTAAEATDSLTALAILLGGSTMEVPGGRDGPSSSASDADAPGVDKLLAESLAHLMTEVVDGTAARSRSARLVDLTASTHFAAWMISLRTPPLLAPRPPKVWSELAPLFFFAGIPPGSQDEPAVRLAARSFEAVVGEHREYLRRLLQGRLEAIKLPRMLPKGQRTRTLLKLALEHVPNPQLESLVKAVGNKRNLTKICEAVLNEVYPPGHLERGFRSMGRKVGVAGPDRGRGSPRFLLETSVLGLLVYGTVKRSERVPFKDWLDRLYTRFGILIGFGRQTASRDHLRLLDDPGPLYDALASNHEYMRRRLLRAGLAAEYSDAETEVHRREERW